jgi:hypothetical protein
MLLVNLPSGLSQKRTALALTLREYSHSTATSPSRFGSRVSSENLRNHPRWAIQLAVQNTPHIDMVVALDTIERLARRIPDSGSLFP